MIIQKENISLADELPIGRTSIGILSKEVSRPIPFQTTRRVLPFNIARFQVFQFEWICCSVLYRVMGHKDLDVWKGVGKDTYLRLAAVELTFVVCVLRLDSVANPLPQMVQWNGLFLARSTWASWFLRCCCRLESWMKARPHSAKWQR